MSPSQKKAVEQHRKRQRRKGMIRLEINVPKSDKELLRKAAEKLRSGGPVAAQTRAALNAILNPFDSMPLKEMLESAPLEDLPLERSRETGKRIRL